MEQSVNRLKEKQHIGIDIFPESGGPHVFKIELNLDNREILRGVVNKLREKYFRDKVLLEQIQANNKKVSDGLRKCLEYQIHIVDYLIYHGSVDSSIFVSDLKKKEGEKFNNHEFIVAFLNIKSFVDNADQDEKMSA